MHFMWSVSITVKSSYKTKKKIGREKNVIFLPKKKMYSVAYVTVDLLFTNHHFKKYLWEKKLFEAFKNIMPSVIIWSNRR